MGTPAGLFSGNVILTCDRDTGLAAISAGDQRPRHSGPRRCFLNSASSRTSMPSYPSIPPDWTIPGYRIPNCALQEEPAVLVGLAAHAWMS